MDGQIPLVRISIDQCMQTKAFIREVKKTTQRPPIDHDTILDSFQDVIFIVDKTEHFVFVNKASEKRTGIPKKTLIGRHIREIVDPKSYEIVHSSIQKAMKGEKLPPVEIQRETADGEKITLEVSSSTIYEDGVAVAVLGVSRDVTDRKRVKEALVRSKDKLERRVEERTATLVKSNELRADEIKERKAAELSLIKSENELRIKTINLEEANATLRVLLKKRDEDRIELEEKVLSNVKDLVLPYLEKLKRTGLNQRQKTFASILESNIDGIISPFLRQMSSRYLGLTPAEIEVANLVRQGKRTKEIAEVQNLSPKTIEDHRKKLRKKLGLKNKKANLRTLLLSIQ